MKDYTDLFYLKKEKEKLEEVINGIGSIQGKLTFYENELEHYDSLPKAFQELYKLHQELEKMFEEEKAKFTMEELKDLHFKCQEYIKG